MKIDITKIDERIRKLQQIKELASDPETRELLADVLSLNGNGHSPKTRKVQRGSLSDAVERACLQQAMKFTVQDIVNALHKDSFQFAAKDEQVAVYSAMRRLRDRGVIDIVEEGGPGKPAKWIVSAGQKHMKLST